MFNTRSVFILLGVFVALALVGLRVSAILEQRREAVRAAEVQAGGAAVFAAQYAARTYDLADRMAEDVRRRLLGGQMLADPTALHDYLAAQTEATSLDDRITVFDAQGRPLVSSGDISRAAIANRSVWFLAHSERGDEVFHGPLSLDPATGTPVYSFSRRLTDVNGRFAGAVLVSVQPLGVKRVAERRPGEPQSSLWTTTGRFVAATYLDFDRAGQAIALPPPAVVTSGSPGGLISDGGKVLAYAKTPGWPLVAVIEVDKAAVEAASGPEMPGSILVLSVLLFGVGALVSVGAVIAGREAVARRTLEATTAALEVAVAERELLVKEVHHRVRNSLSLTGGVLSLQARQFKDEAVREAFENTQRRLNSIAMVHEALYRGNDLAEVELAEYLRRLISEVAHANGAGERGIVVELDAEPIMLTPEKATPVGLIVSEVLTNAFKHAFAPDKGGRVSLRVLSLPADEVEVLISDNGRGFDPDAPQQRGLGAQLIRILAEQLGARSSSISDRGATFRMVFPRA